MRPIKKYKLCKTNKRLIKRPPKPTRTRQSEKPNGSEARWEFTTKPDKEFYYYYDYDLNESRRSYVGLSVDRFPMSRPTGSTTILVWMVNIASRQTTCGGDRLVVGTDEVVNSLCGREIDHPTLVSSMLLTERTGSMPPKSCFCSSSLMEQSFRSGLA